MHLLLFSSNLIRREVGGLRLHAAALMLCANSKPIPAPHLFPPGCMHTLLHSSSRTKQKFQTCYSQEDPKSL